MSGKNIVYLKKKGKREDQEAVEVKLERTLEKMYAVASKVFHGDVKSFIGENKKPIYNINDIEPGSIIYASFMDLPEQEPKSPEKQEIQVQPKPKMTTPGGIKKNPNAASIPPPPDSTPKVEKRFYVALESQDDGAPEPEEKTPQKGVIFEDPGITNSPESLDNRSVAPSMMTTASQAFNQMSRFGEVNEEIEETLNQNNYSLISSFIGDIPSHYEILDEKAISILQKGLFVPPGLQNYGTFNFHKAIIGPRESGKTIFLRILTDKLVKTLINKMPSRRVAVFYYDMRELKPYLSSPLDILQEFATLTIKQLAAQFPLLRLHQEHNELEKSSTTKTPVLNELIRVITQYAKDEPISPLSAKYPRTPPFEATIMPITEITRRLDASLLSSDNMNMFLTNVFTLPYALATAFGFNKVHYSVDHFDEADIVIKPDGPFKKSDQISAIEFIKLMLTTGSFFIAATNEDNLAMVVEPTDDQSIDLSPRLSLFSTCGIVSPQTDLYALRLKLDDGRTAEIAVDDCGGCSGLLARWEEIAAGAAKMPDREERSRRASKKDGEKSPKKAEEKIGDEKMSSAAKKLRKGLLLKVRELVDLLVPQEELKVAGFTPIFLTD